MTDDMQADIARYNDMNKDEKDIFWLELTEKMTDDVSINTKTKFEHISSCVKAYLKASDTEKNTLWRLYDPLSRRFCDTDRYLHEKKMN
jgi:hypothetical protein